MALCGANQRLLANTAMTYAMSNKRRYPERGNMSGLANVRAYLAPIALTNSRAGYDLRPVIREMGLNVNKNLQCALVAPMDLDDLVPLEWASGNQALWFGWHYTSGRDPNVSAIAGTEQLRGMFKMGDRFEARVVRSRGVIKSYNLLVCDWDLSRPAGPGAQAAHPDNMVMWNWQARRQPLNDSLLTLSYWQTPLPSPLPGIRGPLDNNFAYDDGSVRRVTGIELDDDRMDRIPNTQSEDENSWNGNQFNGHGYQVPKN